MTKNRLSSPILTLLALYGALLLYSTGVQAKGVSFYAPESKLAAGKWVKLQVTGNAIYKLTYEEIQAMGIDPSKAGIYGYGGWILNENFAANDYADDLPATPVWISGSDQKLDPGEYLLFYGKGPVKWAYNASNREYVHTNNPYASYGYYFISDAGGGPSLIEKAEVEASSGTAVTTFDDFAVHEVDQNFVIASGRELYGESFRSSTSQNFRFTIEGMIQESANARLRFISTANIDGTSVKATINESYASASFSAINDSNPGRSCDVSWKWNPNGSNTVDVNVTYSHSGYATYLDYIRLNMKRELKSYGNGYTFFRNKYSQSGNYSYEVGNASANMFVLEITPQKTIRQMNASLSNGKLSFCAKETSSTVREYVVIDPTKSFPKPETVGSIQNQNLHALPGGIDMVIITQPVYWNAAQQLADKHKEISNLNVVVIDANQIYNEFSSGTPDASAYRWFMKMLYDRGIVDNTAPKYLLLFGDASHDNRLITDAWRNYKSSSLLLAYQSENSLLNTNASYVTDDYFGFMDDYSAIDKAKLQLAVGRLPVNNAQEAQTVVNKIIAYMENKNPGAWKNRGIYIGGDEQKESSGQYDHITPADTAANAMVRLRPEMFASKIYYNSFKKGTDKGYDTYPGAVAKLSNKLKEGAILLNYLGHGDPSKIDKYVINTNSINDMKFDITPVWILATCSFSRYDDIKSSAGELALMNPSSAAIATISAARLVYVSPNVTLNTSLIKQIFTKDENGEWPRLGDALRKAKNATTTLNNLSYMLLGDPALSLNLPYSSVRLDSINGIDANSPGIQFRSQEVITLKGSILNEAGEVETGFSGEIHTTLMDCINRLTTYDYKSSSGTDTYNYTEYLNTLYQGKSSVVEGKFSVRIPVPKDISFKNEPGKISFYAVSKTNKSEASGHFTNFIVGGSVDHSDSTEIGAPEIKSIYLNTPSFVSGDVVNETPYLVAEIFDSIGINTSGAGVGHYILMEIDNNRQYKKDLNDYYQASETNPGYGTVRFMIPDSLPKGRHTLTLKVWNIMNLSATAEIDFIVEPGKAPVIFDLTASNNPARNDVYFIFQHDRPETKVSVKIGVFDLTGTPVWTHEETGMTDELATTPVYWDLTSNGSRVKPGVYVYRASISCKHGNESTASKKLIILAQ